MPNQIAVVYPTLQLTGNNPSTSPISGDLLVAGGIGAGGDINSAGAVKAVTLAIGGTTKETHSATQPTSPNTGDLWLELDGSNYPLYGWNWRWNGTYWLSPDMTMESSFSNVSASSLAGFYCNPSFNYYFRSLNFTALTTTTQSTGNLWTISIDRRNATNVATVIGSATTNGNAANAEVRTPTSILTQVNTSSTGTIGFYLNAVPAGAAGSLYIGIQAIYNYARI